MLLSNETRREFAERGYIVVPAVLSPREVRAAMTMVDDFVVQTPPPDGHRGHHFYWPALAPRHPLLGLLLDGATPPEPDGRPGTFTMLAGLLLTDQTSENAGNLWVWPGTHRAHEALFRERGPDALLSSRGLPDITLPAPEQVLGRAGDLLLAHYMLSHNIGGNTSPNVRRVIYYRLQREGHRDRWRDCVRDALLEFDAVRAALATD